MRAAPSGAAQPWLVGEPCRESLSTARARACGALVCRRTLSPLTRLPRSSMLLSLTSRPLSSLTAHPLIPHQPPPLIAQGPRALVVEPDLLSAASCTAACASPRHSPDSVTEMGHEMGLSERVSSTTVYAAIHLT